MCARARGEIIHPTRHPPDIGRMVVVVVITCPPAAKGLRAAVKGVGTLLPSCERAALRFELRETDRGKGRSGVMLSLVVVDLVDWHCCVDDVWLHRLPVHDGLE